jgi:hypothetical protein
LAGGRGCHGASGPRRGRRACEASSTPERARRQQRKPYGNIGIEWQVAGFGPFHALGASDMILRNVNSGQFEVYDIVNNQITAANSLGSVGLDWSVGGFAVDPPTLSGTFTDISNDQLVQAMASFGGGATDDSNSIFVGDETSQQQFLTVPQHA